MEFQAVLKAIKDDAIDVIKGILDSGFNVNEKNGFHHQPLLCSAVREGHKDIVELLLSHGAHVNKETTSGDNALHIAIQRGRIDLIDLLVRAGAEINIGAHISGKKVPPLHAAVQNKQLEAVRYLIDAGAEVNVMGAMKHSRNYPIHWATMFEEPEILNELLRANAALDCKNDEKSTPLHTASLSGHKHNVKRLIDCGAPIDCFDAEGFTPLMVAVRRGHLECVRHLCVAGAHLNITSNAGQTPLNLAISHGHVSVIRMLLKFGASANEIADVTSSRLPIHVAVRSCIHRSKGKYKNLSVMVVNKEIEILDSLLQHGADLNVIDKDGLTALHHSITNSCEAITEYLIKAGANYLTVDYTGSTVLFLACNAENGMSDNTGSLIQLLVSLCPALLNHVMHSCLDPAVRSPFVVSARRANKRTLRFLMAGGYRCSQAEIDACVDDTRIPDEVRQWIQKVCYQPLPLERIAKVRVRNLMPTRIHSKIYKITIPQKLREILLLKNIHY